MAAGGQFPAPRWRAGVTFDDSYTLLLPAKLPPGRHCLFVGLYHAADLTRLPAFDRDGKRSRRSARRSANLADAVQHQCGSVISTCRALN